MALKKTVHTRVPVKRRGVYYLVHRWKGRRRLRWRCGSRICVNVLSMKQIFCFQPQKLQMDASIDTLVRQIKFAHDHT